MWASLIPQYEALVSEVDDISSVHATKYDIPLLTSKSRRQEPNTACSVALWNHQKAMLARCMEIEETPSYATTTVRNAQRYFVKDMIPVIKPCAFGVMNDPPGSGKTYALLSLIAMDSKKGLNVIIVPQNIFTQWTNAIKTIFPTDEHIKYKFCDNYGDVTGFYGRRELQKYDIILVNDVFAETLATSINDTKTPIRRLIIDEIDSIQNRLYTPITADHVWMVSASFIQDEHCSVGPYNFKKLDIPNIFCKCDPEFVEESLKFETPTIETIVCEDNECGVFKNCVNSESMLGLNAGDTRPLLAEFGLRISPRTSITDIVNLYIKKLYADTERLGEYEKDFEEEKANEKPDPILVEQYTTIIKEYKQLREKADELEKRLKEYEPSMKSKKKVFVDQICTRMLENKSEKWLVFNDNASALYETADILKEKGIDAVLLDGGNANEISKAVADYKSDKIQVLLLNSTMEGAGMNLEVTKYLVFMHLTEQRMVQQIVGRAQRFGREGALQIILLINKNENEDLIQGNVLDADKIGLKKAKYDAEAEKDKKDKKKD